ncbi:MAG: CvpA family protein [Chitinivibrionia bacterium]|nr:CvpA family protein [Chitinivibrionia bacterium]
MQIDGGLISLLPMLVLSLLVFVLVYRLKKNKTSKNLAALVGNQEIKIMDKVKKYFDAKKPSTISIIATFVIIGAVVALLSGEFRGLTAVFGGTIGFVVGYIILFFNRLMTDTEYDNLVKSKTSNVTKEKALTELGLDEDEVKEIAPVCFEGYNFVSAQYSKVRENGKLVSSCYTKSWLFFSDTQTYTYSHDCHFDKNLQKDITQEFFYKDVTSVYAERSDKQAAFELIVPNAKFYAPMKNTEENANIVQAMKQKLREKKQA